MDSGQPVMDADSPVLLLRVDTDMHPPQTVYRACLVDLWRGGRGLSAGQCTSTLCVYCLQSASQEMEEQWRRNKQRKTGVHAVIFSPSHHQHQVLQLPPQELRFQPPESLLTPDLADS